MPRRPSPFEDFETDEEYPHPRRRRESRRVSRRHTHSDEEYVSNESDEGDSLRSVLLDDGDSDDYEEEENDEEDDDVSSLDAADIESMDMPNDEDSDDDESGSEQWSAADDFGDAHSARSGDDEEGGFLAGGPAVRRSSHLPELRSTMRRLVRVDELLSRTPAHPQPSDDAQTPTRSQLLETQHFLWSRFARIIADEHRHSSDLYSMSLNFHDRSTFEHLTHTIHRNTKFCEVLEAAAIVPAAAPASAAVAAEGGTSPTTTTTSGLSGADEHALAQQIAKLVHYTTYLICEGTREALLTPMSVPDLLPCILREPQRSKRLSALSLLFSMFDQDESSIGESMAAGLPKVLLMRTRATVGQMTDLAVYAARAGGSQSASPTSRPLDAEAATTPTRSGAAVSSATTQQHGNSSPMIRAAPMRSTRGTGRDGRPVSRSSSPLLSSHTRGALSASTPLRRAKRPREDDSAEKPTELPPSSTTISAGGLWEPKIGERVGRGPGWRHKDQGLRCDYGIVVGVTATEVLVRWEASSDFLPAVRLLASAGVNLERIFRYTIYGPQPEVVPWGEFLRAKTLAAASVSSKLEELFLMGAILGVLCNQKDSVLPAYQYQVVECMMALIDLDAAGSYLHYQAALRAAVCAHPEYLNEVANNTDSLDDATASHDALLAKLTSKLEAEIVRWDDSLNHLGQHFRSQRELVARGLWVLNAVLQHKKLALTFLELGGLQKVLAIAKKTCITTNLYGCALILSQLARPAVFEEILLRHSRGTFEELMGFALKHLDHGNADVRGSIAAFFFHTLSFPQVLEWFDAHGGPAIALRLLEQSIVSNRNAHDVLNPTLCLVMFRTFIVYLGSNVLLQTRVLFRRHRSLSVALNKPSTCSLPRDAQTLEAVLSVLLAALEGDGSSDSCPSHLLPDVSREAVIGQLLSTLPPSSTQTPLPSASSGASFPMGGCGSIRYLLEHNFHSLLLQSIAFYHDQDRFDLVTVCMQVLRVFSSLPFCRRAIIEEGAQLPANAANDEEGEPPLHARGIPTLLMIMEDCNTSNRDSVASVVGALQTMLLLVTPPADWQGDTDAVQTFQRACFLVRTNNGIRVMLELLKFAPRDVNAALISFPVVAHVIHVLVRLSLYSDTMLLFQALGVHRIAKELLGQYRDAVRHFRDSADVQLQKYDIPINKSVRHFVEHAKKLMVGSAGVVMPTGPGAQYGTLPLALAPPAAQTDGSSSSGFEADSPAATMPQSVAGTRAFHSSGVVHSPTIVGVGPSFPIIAPQSAPLPAHGPNSVRNLLTDPFELMERQAIVARSHLDFSKKSLLRLMHDYLESQGLDSAARALREEALTQAPQRAVSPGAPGSPCSTNGSDTTGAARSSRPTLDGIVRSYLRYQHESSTNPIATLPKFDLTRAIYPNMYSQRTSATGLYDAANNILCRLQFRKEGLRIWDRCRHVDTHQFYRQYRFLFDIRGGDDGLQAQSLAFCDSGNSLMVGTSEGGIAIFDTAMDLTDDKMREQHIVFEDDGVNQLLASPDDHLIAATCDRHICHIMRRDALPGVTAKIENTKAVHFASRGLSSLLLCTAGDTSTGCFLHDLVTSSVVATFDEGSTSFMDNLRNVAQFDETGNLILNDGTLWDRRSSDRPLFHFDRITESFCGRFHPNNRHVIIDKSVWDLRMLSMLFSCPPFQGSQVFPSRGGSILFAFRDSEATHLLSAVDGQTYELIGTYDMRPSLRTFAADPHGCLFAGVQDSDVDTAVRIFGFGLEPDDDKVVAESEEPIDEDIDGSDSEVDFDDDGDYSHTSDDDSTSYGGSTSTSSSGEDDDDASDEDEAVEESDVMMNRRHNSAQGEDEEEDEADDPRFESSTAFSGGDDLSSLALPPRRRSSAGGRLSAAAHESPLRGRASRASGGDRMSRSTAPPPPPDGNISDVST